MTLISTLNSLIEVLVRFKEQESLRINISKLQNHLEIKNELEMDVLINLIFRFQDLFLSKLGANSLVKVFDKGDQYICLRKRDGVNYTNEIYMKKNHIKVLSDIIYSFTHVNIGKGFSLKLNGSELSKKLKLLYKIHPYFFEQRGNGHFYPTKLAIDTGMLVQSYNRSNRETTQLTIDDYLIKIV